MRRHSLGRPQRASIPHQTTVRQKAKEPPEELSSTKATAFPPSNASLPSPIPRSTNHRKSPTAMKHGPPKVVVAYTSPTASRNAAVPRDKRKMPELPTVAERSAHLLRHSADGALICPVSGCERIFKGKKPMQILCIITARAREMRPRGRDIECLSTAASSLTRICMPCSGQAGVSIISFIFLASS